MKKNKMILKSKMLGNCTIEDVKLHLTWDNKEVEHIEFKFNQKEYLLLLNRDENRKIRIFHGEREGECSFCKRDGLIRHTWCPELTKKIELLYKILINHPSVRLRLLKYQLIK